MPCSVKRLAKCEVQRGSPEREAALGEVGCKVGAP